MGCHTGATSSGNKNASNSSNADYEVNDWGEKVYKFKTDLTQNAPIVNEKLEQADTLFWNKKPNTISFLRHEGSLLEVKNLDNVNVRELAKKLGKRYDESW